MKKGKLLFASGCCLLLVFLPACDFFDNCGKCEFVTVDENGNESYGPLLPYCDEDLQERQNSSPETVGGITTYWNCY